MTRRARVLGEAELRRVATCARRLRYPERNTVIILLSFRAGLRACEIAGLTWPMVLRPNGRSSESISLPGTITKNGKARFVPLHRELKAALVRLHRTCDRPCDGAVVRSERGGHMTPRGIVNWFARLYAQLGYNGCSSHSGRRTFITRTARLVGRVGGSLRDVQELAGHASLKTTEAYIAGDRDAQRKLVRLL